MESQNNDKRQNLPQAASGEKKSAKAEKEEKTDIRAKPALQENKEPTGAANVGVVDLSNGGSVLFEKLQQITANVTDPVQQLLMVPDEGFESMKETVTQTIRSMTPEQRRLLTVSCKQLLGYATQTPRGATRAAEIVNILQHEAADAFKFEFIFFWFRFLMPCNYMGILYSTLSWAQIFHLGIFLATLFKLFKNDPLQETIFYYLSQALWCLAHDDTPEGQEHFKIIFEISCGQNVPTM